MQIKSKLRQFVSFCAEEIPAIYKFMQTKHDSQRMTLSPGNFPSQIAKSGVKCNY